MQEGGRTGHMKQPFTLLVPLILSEKGFKEFATFTKVAKSAGKSHPG